MAELSNAQQVEQALQLVIGKRLVNAKVEEVEINSDREYHRLVLEFKDSPAVVIESYDFEGYMSGLMLPEED
jgi:hypothetical protein